MCLKHIKNIFLPFIFILSSLDCLGQKKVIKEYSCPYEYNLLLKSNVVLFSDHPPTYKGGISAILKYIAKHLELGEQNTQFHFKIEYIIDKNGNLIFASIADKKTTDLSETESKLLKVFKQLKKWSPGQCLGRPVMMKSILSLSF